MSDIDTLVATAESIGRRICGDAIWHDGHCNWLGDSMEFVENEWRVVHRACGPSLYDGTSGIALFLAGLYQVAGDRRIRSTAIAGLRHALAHASSVPEPARLGLYAGQAGIAYAAREAGVALEVDDIVSKGEALFSTLTPESDAGHGLDVIGGVAGTIPLLLRRRDDQSRTLALALGERLVARADRHNGVASWDTMPTPRGRHLTGYSHGAAGIALALLELGMITGDERFVTTASAGVAYERRHFLADQGNWPDFRAETESNPYPAEAPGSVLTPCAMAWCHGAPGIGLARLRTYELTREPAARAEAEIALATTRRVIDSLTSGSVFDFSPCHGAAGLAELFVLAADVLDDQSYLDVAKRIAVFGIERIVERRLPWPCGVPNGGETPTLLTGLAGIGHFYLRLARPEGVPSVLMVRTRELDSVTEGSEGSSL